MNDHLDLDALADVLAGVAAPEHLDACTSCRARLAELAAALPAVTATLAALPVPAEPPGLAARVTAAVAAAAAEQRPTGRNRDVVPLSGRAPRWPLPWKAAAGLAAAAVLATGATLLLSGGAAHRTSTAAKGWHTSSTGTDYGAGVSAVEAALPALLRGPVSSQGPAAASAMSAGRAAAGTPTAPTAAPTDPLARLRTTQGLAQCLVALSDPNSPVTLPLALDYARYHGAPALVVVLPASKPSKVDVFVVGPACAPADAKVLLFVRVPRP